MALGRCNGHLRPWVLLWQLTFEGLTCCFCVGQLAQCSSYFQQCRLNQFICFIQSLYDNSLSQLAARTAAARLWNIAHHQCMIWKVPSGFAVVVCIRCRWCYGAAEYGWWPTPCRDVEIYRTHGMMHIFILGENGHHQMTGERLNNVGEDFTGELLLNVWSDCLVESTVLVDLADCWLGFTECSPE